MMHYSASEETNVELKPEGMLLVDSGGQYLEGTTDITRTFVLGPISDEIRTHYTCALRGMIQLSRAKFLEGCRGMNLDILARGPLWEMGIDYKCGNRARCRSSDECTRGAKRLPLESGTGKK